MYEEFTSLTLEEAEAYNRQFAPQRVRDHMANIIHSIAAPRGATVLDLGCGNGIDAPRYNIASYIGIDIGENIVAAARKLNPGYTFLQCDLSAGIPVYAEFGIMKSVLEHVPNEGQALAIFENALLAVDTLLIAWHTPPEAARDESEIIHMKGHFNKNITQNKYALAPFKALIDAYNARLDISRVDNFQLWVVRNDRPE